MAERTTPGQPLAFLAGGGEMGERMRAKDWSATPLGPAERWPQSLKTAVRIMLTSRQPIWIGWGSSLIYLYNDPYRAIVGGKHPQALGLPTGIVWSEIWDVIGPMLHKAMAGKEGTYEESRLLIMERNGYREETYYTFSYSPIPNDDGGAGGVICANTDDTRRVIGERQLGLLRELGASTANTHSWRDACAGARRALESNPRDLPFALIYVSPTAGGPLELAELCGLDRSHPAAAKAQAWPLHLALDTREIVLVDDLNQLLGAAAPTGAWDAPPSRAALIPLAVSTRAGRGGVLVVGLNPFRLFDEDYRNFLNLVGGQIAAGIASAQAYEEERRRAEALAELDRAKTAFFSNVSHEFRTPLTLMLGPIEDLLEKSYTDLTPATKNQLEIVHRNSLRLMRLVNTLLDFSRIEAGRLEANYAPVDLAGFTAELASIFRAAIERAGLRLTIDCPPLPAPVYVDREMWEQIVLNLLSNALKFTLAGEIAVTLEAAAGEARLAVRDTGVGIPPADVPRVFERFHRVRESRGRTHEGTGIGLALVKELVGLHGGAIRVESKLDAGSCFVVTVPLGRAHLDPSRIRALAERAPGRHGVEAFVQEALRWMPGTDQPLEVAWARASGAALGPPSEDRAAERPQAPRPRILWADDNADMRDYVSRLLGERFSVQAVADGQAALEAIRAERPELVLSDVMMPRLDGFGLIRALRSDPELNTIPVILLSARAGEEARVVGAEAGADDYLIKPFSARELLARVESHLKLARIRRETEAALRESEARVRKTNAELVQRVAELQQAAAEIKESRRAAMNLMQEAVRSREQVERLNRDLQGEVAEREAAHTRLRQRTAQFETLLSQAPIGVYVIDADFRISEANSTALRAFGDLPDLIGRDFAALTRMLWPPAFAEDIVRRFRQTLETGEPYAVAECSERRLDREATEFYEWRIDRIPVPDGRFGVVAYFRDISAQVRTRAEIKAARDEALAANRAKDQFLATLSHELRTPLTPVLLAASHAADDPTLPEAIRADFKMVADNISLQARLIDDLLDFSRIIHGKAALERRTLDLHQVIRDAAATIREEIAAKRLELSFDLGASAPWVDGDPVRLRQVFWNVLKNAVKFTPAGGRIEIQSRDVPAARELEIRIHDSGVGLEPEEIGRLFHPFVQGRHAAGARTDASGGLGLGLAISRMLLESHGGSVTAASPGPGQGTTLILRLPARAADQAEFGPARNGAGGGQPAAEGRPPHAHRVLFVEDHEPTRATMTRLLEQRGYAVTAARSVTDALQRTAQSEVDVLISDLGLPDGDGCELMAKLRQARPGLVGIALSGYGMEADITRSRAAGFDEHLTKPVSIESIDRALGRLLEL